MNAHCLNHLRLCLVGVKSYGIGAHAEDWNRWRSLLYNLYNDLVSEISHIGSRGKYITGARHIAVKDNLIELTADICHQVMKARIHYFQPAVLFNYKKFNYKL